MKWNCPDSIRVVGIDYQIVFDPIRTAALHICGETNNRLNVITIDPTMPTQMQRATLLHEVCHAIMYQFGLSNVFDEKTEEQIVNAVSNGLFDIVRDGKVKF